MQPDDFNRDKADFGGTRGHFADDEISLRDLYLVLKRRWKVIIATSLVSGVAALGFIAIQPPVYKAETTTIVSRPPLEIDLGESLRFRPEVTVTFETYSTLARSRAVLEAISEQFNVGVDILSRQLDLSLVTQPGNRTTNPSASAFLAVNHVVRWHEPTVAAEIANSWAAATIERAQSVLLENLDTVELVTGDGLVGARRALSDAELASGSFAVTKEQEVSRIRVDRQLSLAFTVVDTNRMVAEYEVETQRLLRAQQLESEVGRLQYAIESSALQAAYSLETQRLLDGTRLESERQISAIRVDSEDRIVAQRSENASERRLFLLDSGLEMLNLRIAALEKQYSDALAEQRTLALRIERLRAALAGLSGYADSSDNASVVIADAPEVTLSLSGAEISTDVLLQATLAQFRLVNSDVERLRVERSEIQAEVVEINRAIDALDRELELRMSELRRELSLVEQELINKRTIVVAALERERELGGRELSNSRELGALELAQGFANQRSQLEAQRSNGLEVLRSERANVLAELERSLNLDLLALERQLETTTLDLTRDLNEARGVFDALVTIEPGVALVTQIAPAGARVLSTAVAPSQAESNRATLIILLATLVAAFGAVVVVLMAEAVRDPMAAVPRHTPTPTTAD